MLPVTLSASSAAWLLAVGIVICVQLLINIVLSLWRQKHQADQLTQLTQSVSEQSRATQESQLRRELQNQQLQETLTTLNQAQHTQRAQFDAYLIKSQQSLNSQINQSMQDVRTQLTQRLDSQAQQARDQAERLTKTVDQKLNLISGQVEKRLSDGFEKTATLFHDVVKRLALIDQAQQKITELSNNVVNLQAILSDKHARGAFGEMQLSILIQNVMPSNAYALQHTFSTGKRVDCLLRLPEPTGNIAIDAKFPLDTYQLMTASETPDAEKKKLRQVFRQDVKKHIQDIADKYIIAEETADSAMMFIPAEAVFAEIHAHYPEVISFAHQAKVWLASPTTLMAILTTSLAVIKDVETRKQVHLIQRHLHHLSQDFNRFQKRMDILSRHIEQAHNDVSLVHTSSKKITSRFAKIEQVELQAEGLGDPSLSDPSAEED